MTRQIAQITLDGVDDETPLGLLAHLAEGDELVADVVRQAKAQLWIVFDALATVTSGRTANSPGCAVSCDARRHTIYGLC